MQNFLNLLTKLPAYLMSLLFLASFSASAAPTINFTFEDGPSDNITVSEKSGLLKIVATLSEVQTQDVSFSFNYLFGDAEIFKDFSFPIEVTGDISGQSKGATVTFAVGVTSQTFNLVNIINDIYDEGDETLAFSISNSQGATLEQTAINVTIIDDEKTPTLALISESLTRNSDGSYSAAINEGAGGVALKLALTNENNLSSNDIAVSFSIDQPEGVTLLSPDYTNPGVDGKIIIPAEGKEVTFQIPIFDDLIIESLETITFTLTVADNAIIHETRRSITITINDDDSNAGAINDTGVTTCYDADINIINCGTPNSVGGFPALDQDGFNGLPSASRYTKLDENGAVQSSTFNSPSCIYDENTNLIWQVSRDGFTYSWLNKIESVNGGNEGFEGTEGNQSMTCSAANAPCNTENYAKVLNKLTGDAGDTYTGLCNIQNWRLPKLRELMSIMDFEPDNDELILINEPYFTVARSNDAPGTRRDFYWTSTPSAVEKSQAWCVYFGKTQSPHIRLCGKHESKLVRMVATCNSDNPNSPC